MEYSAAWDGMLDSLFSSRWASFFASSGMPDFSIFAVYSETMDWFSSMSPSSFWMAFICWRRMYSRCSFSISSFASLLIFWPRLRTSF